MKIVIQLVETGRKRRQGWFLTAGILVDITLSVVM